MTNVRQPMVLILALVVMACAGNRPQKEKSQPQAFDPERYLTAQAQGSTEGEAKGEALAALAAIFESRVLAESEARAQSDLLEQGGELFQKQVSQMVRIQTDVQLEGARIGWVGPDDNDRGYRAVAVLDRRRAAQRWGSELVRIHMDLDAARQALGSTTGRLPRLAALNRMAGLMAQMAVVESRLSVLGRPPVPPDIDLTAFLAERAQLISEVAFYIGIDGADAGSFAHRLGSGLTANGYVLAVTMEQAAGRVSGKIWTEPLNLQNPDVRFVRALAEIVLVDLDTGAQIAAFSENVRKGHNDQNEARRRAVDQLADISVEKINQVLGTLGVAAD